MPSESKKSSHSEEHGSSSSDSESHEDKDDKYNNLDLTLQVETDLKTNLFSNDDKFSIFQTKDPVQIQRPKTKSPKRPKTKMKVNNRKQSSGRSQKPKPSDESKDESLKNQKLKDIKKAYLHLDSIQSNERSSSKSETLYFTQNTKKKPDTSKPSDQNQSDSNKGFSEIRQMKNSESSYKKVKKMLKEHRIFFEDYEVEYLKDNIIKDLQPQTLYRMNSKNKFSIKKLKAKINGQKNLVFLFTSMTDANFGAKVTFHGEKNIVDARATFLISFSKEKMYKPKDDFNDANLKQQSSSEYTRLTTEINAKNKADIFDCSGVLFRIDESDSNDLKILFGAEDLVVMDNPFINKNNSSYLGKSYKFTGTNPRSELARNSTFQIKSLLVFTLKNKSL